MIRRVLSFETRGQAAPCQYNVCCRQQLRNRSNIRIGQHIWFAQPSDSALGQLLESQENTLLYMDQGTLRSVCNFQVTQGDILYHRGYLYLESQVSSFLTYGSRSPMCKINHRIGMFDNNIASARQA